MANLTPSIHTNEKILEKGSQEDFWASGGHYHLQSRAVAT